MAAEYCVEDTGWCLEMNALQYTCAWENYDWKEVQKWNQLHFYLQMSKTSQ